MLGIDKDFLEIDDSTNWFSANVTGTKHILFRMPAFPNAFWPWLKGSDGEEFMKNIQDQVPEPVQKAMNHAHSVFAPDSDTAQSVELHYHGRTCSPQYGQRLLGGSSWQCLRSDRLYWPLPRRRSCRDPAGRNRWNLRVQTIPLEPSPFRHPRRSRWTFGRKPSHQKQQLPTTTITME
jgi:hypothetical protein